MKPTLAAFILTLPILVHAQAAVDDPSCLLARTANENYWFVYVIETTTDPFEIHDFGRDAGAPFITGMKMYDPALELTSFGGRGNKGANQGVRVEVGGSPVAADVSSNGGANNAWHNWGEYNREGRQSIPPGAYALIFYAAGNGTWGFRICGDGVTTATMIASGPEAFVYKSESFDVTPMGYDVSAHLLEVGARAHNELQKRIDVNGTLLGFFGDISVESGIESRTGIASRTLWATTANKTVECVCRFDHIVGSAAWESDSYVFYVSDSGAGFSSMHEVMLGGAIIDPAAISLLREWSQERANGTA